MGMRRKAWARHSEPEVWPFMPYQRSTCQPPMSERTRTGRQLTGSRRCAGTVLELAVLLAVVSSIPSGQRKMLSRAMAGSAMVMGVGVGSGTYFLAMRMVAQDSGP